MENNTLTRRQREYLRHRNEVLDVALRLFSEKGYHNVPMQEIAKEAEFAIGTLYKFFENKEELYKALVLRLADTFHHTLTSVLEIPSHEMDKLRRFLQTKGDLFADNLPMIRLYFTETRGATFNIKAGLDTKLRQSHDEVLHKLAEVFKSGIRKKIFNGVADPYTLAVGFDSLSNGFLFLWLEKPAEHPYPEKVDMIMDIFFSRILRADVPKAKISSTGLKST